MRCKSAGWVRFLFEDWTRKLQQISTALNLLLEIPIQTSLKFKGHLKSFRVTHYIIFNVILYAFYKLNGGKLDVFLNFIRKMHTKW